MSDSEPGLSNEIHPYLLYREDAGQARFATWRVNDGHEALAMFTTAEGAAKYGADLAEPEAWTRYEPPRDKLIEILAACRSAGILYAALDPLGGTARTLFDIPQVLAAARPGV
jgi:hypothetical protein